MVKRFETEADLTREENAIALFSKYHNAEYYKLDKNDIDYKVIIKGQSHYIEVKGRNRNEQDCYPLPLAARKMVKICDKNAPAIIIWDCYDAIIYGNVKEINAYAKYSGRKPRAGSKNDKEYMLYFERQQGLQTINKQIIMEQKNNSGAIFKNDYKKTEQQPDYKGKAMIDGKDKEIALWLNESKNGKKYFSIKFSEPYQAEVEAGYGHKPKEAKDDLPF